MDIKKLYLLTLGFIPNFSFATSEKYLVDEVIANVGTESIFLSDLTNTLFQLKYQNEDISEEQVINQFLQNASLVTKGKENSFVTDIKTINGMVNERMKSILSKFYNNPKLVERYLGKRPWALRKDLEKNLKEQYLVEKVQSQFLEDVRCTNKNIIKFFEKLKAANKIPTVKESFEAYELVLFPEEDPQILNTMLDIRKKLDEGENFIDLIKKYSQDEESVENDGELGWFKIGELRDEYERAALALKPGEISKIVKTDIGYHIIQLIDIRDGEFNSRHIFRFSTKKDDMSSLMDKANDIRSQILDHKISWNDAIKKFSGDDSMKPSLGAMIDDISDEDLDVLKNLHKGEISAPISCVVDNKKAVKIIYLRRIIPEHPLNLDNDYEKISSMTKNYLRQCMLQKKIKEVVDNTDIKVDPYFVKVY
jgi:peptidyl-prolyl cis-trans isomerase SurA